MSQMALNPAASRTMPAQSSSRIAGTSLRVRMPTSHRRQHQGLGVLAAVKVGEKAPDFSLPDQSGNEVKLSKYTGGLFGKKPVVLYFYPADGTPGCTKQAKAFKDTYTQFKKAGAEVIGVSGDSVESHVAFKKDLGLPFPLLADEDNVVRKQYGVPKDFLGLLEGRQTYVIGKDGVVKLVYNDQFAPEKHAEEALKALAA